MIEKVKAGIANKLDAAFNGVPVYAEEIKQGLDGPCFFIKVIRTDETHIVGRRYQRSHAFDVHYFPPQGETENADIDVKRDLLYEVLEYIDIAGGQNRGTSMNAEQVDGVLHFMVQYNFNVVRQFTPEQAMETMVIDLDV